MSYGKRIRERREELKMTQEELSVKSGVSRQTIWMLECEKSDDVLVGTLAALAKALDTTVEYFFAVGV